jgi:hypothetical protein
MRKRYECIGGPLCGEKFPLFDGMSHSQAFGTIARDGESHYYRLCIVRDELDRVAKFWHYAGTMLDPSMPPTLLPPRRMFRENC